MKTDLYTKIVLTVIAICLTVNVLKEVNIIPNAYAETPTSNLNTHKNYGLVPLNADGSIDVHIKSNSTEMDVNIVKIRTSENFNVNVTGVDSYAFSHCTVPVKVK